MLFTVSWGLLHAGFWQRTQIVDTPVYQHYGEAVLDGRVPYRDFDLEYPPAALPVFVLPALARADDYREAFELLMWAAGRRDRLARSRARGGGRGLDSS